MGTYSVRRPRQQATRLRFDGIWLGLAAMIVSAAIVVILIGFGLSLLFSLQPAPVLP